MNDQYTKFDVVEYLDDEKMIQGYLDEAVSTGHAGFIASALGDIAKARGMNNLAKTTGLSRETLYRTLSEKGNPNLKSLLGICSALKLKINISHC